MRPSTRWPSVLLISWSTIGVYTWTRWLAEPRAFEVTRLSIDVGNLGCVVEVIYLLGGLKLKISILQKHLAHIIKP